MSDQAEAVQLLLDWMAGEVDDDLHEVVRRIRLNAIDAYERRKDVPGRQDSWTKSLAWRPRR